MLEKVMQNGAKITKNDAKMVLKLVQNRSKINLKIDSNIDAKFVVQKSIKNRALERQRVAKVTSVIQRREVFRPQGSLYSQKVRPLDSKTAALEEVIPTRPRARGPANYRNASLMILLIHFDSFGWCLSDVFQMFVECLSKCLSDAC